MTLDSARPRRIVRLAADEESSASEWLRLDERGTWERRAAELLEISAERAASLGMTAEQVDEAAALHLRYEAVSALLADAKQRRNRS